MDDGTHDTPGPDALKRAVAALVSQKAEHQPLVQQIAADTGMSAETRAALLEHVLKEEIETVARIAQLTGAAGSGGRPGGAPVVPGGRSADGLTVGSMRPEIDATPATQGSVGSLRRG